SQAYNDAVQAMLAYAYQGAYFPKDYITVMLMVTQLDNPLQLSMPDVIDKLVQGMQVMLNLDIEGVAEDFKQFDISPRNVEYEKHVHELRTKAMMVFDNWKVEKIRFYHGSIARQMEQDPGAFIEKLRSDRNLGHMANLAPFAKEMDAQQLINS